MEVPIISGLLFRLRALFRRKSMEAEMDEELRATGADPRRRGRRTDETIEAMRALWTQTEASYGGQHVRFGPAWAWPKPVQPRIPVLLGAAGTRRTFRWIAAHADGWITTPGEQDIEQRIADLRLDWQAAGRAGQPEVSVLAGRPDPAAISNWQAAGATEVLFGLPDRPEDEVAAYVERLAGKLAAAV